MSLLRKELTADEQAIYDTIKSTADMGIIKSLLKRKLKTIKDEGAFNNSINSLLEMQKIKQVMGFQNKQIYLMDKEIEPSSVLITRSPWYTHGTLDLELIHGMKKFCIRIIRRHKVATVETISQRVNHSKAFEVEISKGHIHELLKVLVLDGEIMEVKSTGCGEYASIPTGMVCYKIVGSYDATING